jgi:hypothetical protein
MEGADKYFQAAGAVDAVTGTAVRATICIPIQLLSPRAALNDTRSGKDTDASVAYSNDAETVLTSAANWYFAQILCEVRHALLFAPEKKQP